MSPIKEVFDALKARGVMEAGAGATAADVQRAETLFGFEFPPPLRELYLLSDGCELRLASGEVWTVVALEHLPNLRVAASAGNPELFGDEDWVPLVDAGEGNWFLLSRGGAKSGSDALHDGFHEFMPFGNSLEVMFSGIEALLRAVLEAE